MRCSWCGSRLRLPLLPLWNGSQSTHSAFATTPMNTLALTNTALTGTLYFRIYAYGASGSIGTWRLDNLNLQGAVTPIPTGGGWYIDSVFIEDAVCCGSP